MLKWNLLSKFQIPNSKFQPNLNAHISKIVEILLENRGLKTKKEIDKFLHPKLEEVTVEAVDIDKKQLNKALKRVQKAIQTKERVVVYGDYDVDGITGTAILWETLYALGANVLPYIPHRVEEGYGLSVAGIKNVILNLFQDFSKNEQKIPKLAMGLQVRHDRVGLIITVDNGIVANDAVEFANEQGIDVIITDHHTLSEQKPNAHAIVHTTKLCGAGVAFLFAKEITSSEADQLANKFLDLVALATIADLVPLTGANRTLLKIGLSYLQNTTRPGLKALFEEAQIDPRKIGVYEVGHIISPRLNAMGRLESAMDSLRLLCTKNKERAKLLAKILGKTNRERQLLTQAAGLHAVQMIKNRGVKIKKILFLAENYEEGIIGLVAGKLVETYYRPAIVLSRSEKISKASARSVKGFNIIEFIRKSSHLLINAGGHPMAAGFTVETEKILFLKEFLETQAEIAISDDHLTRSINIDCILSLEIVTQDFYEAIQALSPFGMGNPEPTFLSKNVVVEDINLIGKDKKHVKMKLKNIDAIGFNLAEKTAHLKPRDTIDMVYSIDENEWMGRKNLQLKVRDIKKIN